MIFVSLTFLITLTFFKSVSSSTDSSAKNDSRADMSRLIQKTIVIYAFTFLYDDNSQWFLISLFLILSILSFERNFHLHSYYNEDIQFIHNCFRALCLWSTIALSISKVFDLANFNGGLQLFILGIPLVVALVWFTRDTRKDEMMLNANYFQQGDEVAR